MATRSTIGRLHSNGSVTAVYSHWDGYPEHNGRILMENYTDEAVVDELINLGFISSLGKTIGEKHEFDNPFQFGTPEYTGESERRRNITTFYGRDRGETDVDSHTFSSVREFVDEFSEEYNYLFINGDWYVNSYGETAGGEYVFEPVELALAKREANDED